MLESGLNAGEVQDLVPVKPLADVEQMISGGVSNQVEGGV